MATFKSTSRRGAPEAEARAPPSTSRRRSHSVSAVSRKSHSQFDDKTQIPSEFSNRRDNPLFWATSSPPPDREENERINGSAFCSHRQSSASNSRSAGNGNDSCDSLSGQRGRSTTRGLSEKKGIGRSLSRARGRSVSRASFKGAYECGNDRDVVPSSIAQSRKEIRKSDKVIRRPNSVGSRVDVQSRAMNVRGQASECSEDDSACSMPISNLEDGISIGSLSEAEEKAINGAYNDLHGFERNNTASNIVSMPSNFVNAEAVELISEIRREYAIKLEKSEERTRKLRADLAVEQHRGKELDRILKEIPPDPNTPFVSKSRRGRRASNEIKQMSKCLTEDALAYFDECVSLSTFDSSDFSASEDPPLSADLPQKQLYGYDDSSIMTDSCSFDPQSTQRYNFSFTDRKHGPEEEMRSCIKNFEKGTKKDVDFEATSSHYDAGEYHMRGQRESLLIDRVLYKGRIESGGLHLCSGAIVFLPFAPVM
ncbi:galactose oxidase/kelch repeat superfamily protein [Striga asiatica]|uniref:Galactose oxidase/kelch repeat superfamily protein n=1 Tax=Striga asiatica TaxID=4170 RepID=A0A5A7PCE3_STRAF|nr:galactose oxidase/kelch repeat superfamily protein [Striga asiatica]